MSSRSDYERALSRELIAVGISGRLRRRILDEIGDHLSCDPEASLGEPTELAHDFADVVGTARAKTAALAAFASLVVAGLLCAVVFVAAPHGLLRSAQRAGSPGFAALPALVAVIAGQIALAAGCLAGARWLWRRDRGALPAAEAAVIRRRAAVGVGAGMVTMVSLGVLGLAARHQLGSGSSDVAVIAAGVGLLALIAALPSLWAATRVRPTVPGDAGDVFDDLGPLAPAGLRGHPWRLAVRFALGLAAVITVAAVPAQDVYDGALRGLLDGAACLVAFAVLGGYLGLWRPAAPGGSVAD
jgi:hypothetical protein